MEFSNEELIIIYRALKSSKLQSEQLDTDYTLCFKEEIAEYKEIMDKIVKEF